MIRADSAYDREYDIVGNVKHEFRVADTWPHRMANECEPVDSHCAQEEDRDRRFVANEDDDSNKAEEQ